MKTKRISMCEILTIVSAICAMLFYFSSQGEDHSSAKKVLRESEEDVNV